MGDFVEPLHTDPPGYLPLLTQWALEGFCLRSSSCPPQCEHDSASCFHHHPYLPLHEGLRIPPKGEIKSFSLLISVTWSVTVIRKWNPRDRERHSLARMSKVLAQSPGSLKGEKPADPHTHPLSLARWHSALVWDPASKKGMTSAALWPWISKIMSWSKRLLKQSSSFQ